MIGVVLAFHRPIGDRVCDIKAIVMKKLVFSLCCMLFLSALLHGQLEMTAGSYEGDVPVGPVTEVGSVLLLKRMEEGNRYIAPDLRTTVHIALSDMQHKSKGVSQLLTFGASTRDMFKWPASEPVYQEMKSLAKAVSRLYTKTESEGEALNMMTNYGFRVYASVKQFAGKRQPAAGDKVYYGDMTLSFNRAVSDPMLHFVGLGAMFTEVEIYRGFSVELELVSPGQRLEPLSGTDYFEVQPHYISNGSKKMGPNCGAGAVCGSVQVKGRDLTQIRFKVYMKRDSREDAYKGKWPLMRNTHPGDGFIVGVSFANDTYIEGTLAAPDLADQADILAGLYIHLIDPVTNRVVAVRRPDTDLRYRFTGVTGNASYLLQMSSTETQIGGIPPVSGSLHGGLYFAEGQLDGRMLVRVEDQPVSGLDFTVSDRPGAAVATVAMSPAEEQYNKEQVVQDSQEALAGAVDPGAGSGDRRIAEPVSMYKEPQPAFGAEADADDADECFVIVGSFGLRANADRMAAQLRSEGYELYKGDGPNGLTRIGIRTTCVRADDVLTRARREINSGAWIMMPLHF